MRNRYQRAVRRGGWKYLKVADREFLFDIEYDPRERGDLSKKQPGSARRIARAVGGLGARHAAAADQRGGADVEPVRDAVVGLLWPRATDFQWPGRWAGFASIPDLPVLVGNGEVR